MKALLKTIERRISGLVEHYCVWSDGFFVARDESRFAWLGWQILLWGIGGFILWASLAPLDRGVTAPGFLIADSNRKTIQSVSAGVVDMIEVREGQAVKAGQVLIRLNQINAQAQTNALRESIEGLTAQVEHLEQAISQKKKQEAILKQQLSNTRDLVNEGYMAKNKFHEIERTQLQVKASILEDEGSLIRTRKQVRELQEKVLSYDFDLANTEIKSPVDGHVVNLVMFTKGGVVGPGTRLMDIVPTNETLIVEAQLPVHLIDKVQVGLPVEILFTAFNINRTPHIPGTLVAVGGDRIVEERSGMSYYKVQATIGAEGMRLLGKRKIQPGMPVELFIKTGERSLMSYLLKPILDRTHSALRED
jgi:protease secretion system membrane fusion protein